MGRNWTPSIVPNGEDQTVYLVADDLGQMGRKADFETTDLETITADLLTGQYKNPIRGFPFLDWPHTCVKPRKLNVIPFWPGSLSRAKVRDGSSGNLSGGREHIHPSQQVVRRDHLVEAKLIKELPLIPVRRWGW